jgi:chromosome segregation ATPase
VNDLLKYKEQAISLRSQLKIAEEKCNLQQAEFAFERGEYEKEIEFLKRRPAATSMIPPTSPNRYDVDVSLQQSTAKQAALARKYEKWKASAHLLKGENRELHLALQRATKDQEKLRDELESLRSTFATHAADLDAEREQAVQLREEGDLTNAQLRHTEAKASEAEDAKSRLQADVRDLTHQLLQATEKAKRLRSDLKQIQFERKAESDSLQLQLRDITTEKVNLQSVNRRLKAQIKAQELQIDSLASEKKGAISSADAVTSQMSAMEEENQQLRLSAKSLTKRSHRLEKIADELLQHRRLVQHAESELTALCDLLGCPLDELSQKWVSVCQRCEELMAAVATVNDIEQQKEALERQVNSDLRQRRIPTVSSQTEESEGEYFGNMLTLVKELKSSNQESLRKISQLKFQHEFSARIVELYAEFTREVTALRDSLCAVETVSLRPFALAVLFARRIAALRGQRAANDASALGLFGGRLSCAPDVVVKDLSTKVKSLTQNLVAVKQRTVDFEMRLRDITDERDQRDMELKSVVDKAAVISERYRTMRDRLFELQEELSSLVSPDQYQASCQLLAASEAKHTALLAQIQSLESDFKERDKKELKIKKEMERLQVVAQHETQTAGALRNEFGKKDHQVSEVEAMLKEKTKEVLALERLVHRQREKANVEGTSIGRLAAENQNLHRKLTRGRTFDFDPDSEAPMLGGMEGGIATTINPAFLS